MRVNLTRAWKDPVYRASLEPDLVHGHPAGLVELSDEELKQASGVMSLAQTTCQCCTDTSRFRRCCP